MFQTWWDVNRQTIRKTVDTLSGVAIGWLGSQGEWGAALVPVALLAANFAWFWIDNKSKVTVAGLEAAGAGNAAVLVENAIDRKAKG